MNATQFENALRSIINIHCAENESNTPDFILAAYIRRCLDAYNEAVQERARWYGRMDKPGGDIELTE